MADLIGLSTSSPEVIRNGIIFKFLESIDRNTIRTEIDGITHTFIYIWENRFDPEYLFIGDYKIILSNTFINARSENAYVFSMM